MDNDNQPGWWGTKARATIETVRVLREAESRDNGKRAEDLHNPRRLEVSPAVRRQPGIPILQVVVHVAAEDPE